MIFCRYSMAFTVMLCRFTISMTACYWKSMHQELKEVVPGTWRMFGASWWMFIKSLLVYKIVHVSLFFDSWVWNSECPRQWHGLVAICLTSWIGTPAQSHVISNHFKSLERIQGRSIFLFGWTNALKIKYLSESYFSQKLRAHVFL